jgi:hypothetical protein
MLFSVCFSLGPQKVQASEYRWGSCQNFSGSGFTIQLVFTVMKAAHGYRVDMTDHITMPRATLGLCHLLTHCVPWELEVMQLRMWGLELIEGCESLADAWYAVQDISLISWDLLAQRWSQWSAGSMFQMPVQRLTFWQARPS